MRFADLIALVQKTIHGVAGRLRHLALNEKQGPIFCQDPSRGTKHANQGVCIGYKPHRITKVRTNDQ